MAGLLVEIGNTALKAAWTEGLTIGRTVRYQGEKYVGFILTLIERERPDVMVVASVKELSEEDRATFAEHCGTLVVLDSVRRDCLKYYGLPTYLSYDRAASIIAARRLFEGRSCAIFDFGTTVSVDFIDSEGNYAGGNITPGCRTRFKSLNRYSKCLPLVDTPESVQLKGNSLVSGIESGVVNGMVFEIEGYLAASPTDVVVFTGGDSGYFASKSGKSVFVVPNLVLMGLASIKEDYVK